MGWQDDPVASGWQHDPVVTQAAESDPPETLTPAGELMAGAKGLGEGALHLASQIPASLASGAASAYQLATSPSGSRVSNANKASAATQQAWTYQPRSDAGKAVAGATDATLGLIPKGADYVGTGVQKGAEALGVNPMAAAGIGGGVSTLLQSVPAIFGAKGGARVAAKIPEAIASDTVKTAAKTPEETQTIAKGQALGLKFTPTQAGGELGKTVEGVTGQAALERRLSRQNAPKIDAAARIDIGMDPAAPLTPEGFAALKKGPNAAYAAVARTGKVAVDDTFKSEVAKIGDRSGAASFPEDTPEAISNLKARYGKLSAFDAGDAVSKVRQLRADAVKNQKAINAPEQNALGYAQRQVAEAIDNQLERHAQSLGQEDLVQNLRSARVQLAKIHTVESATKANHVSAASLSKQQQRGVPLTGNLKTLADTYDSFGKSLQDVSKIRNSGPFSVVDYLIGAGSALSNPTLAASVLARPLARGFLSSDLYQNSLRRNFGVPEEAAAEVTPRNALMAPKRANSLAQ